MARTIHVVLYACLQCGTVYLWSCTCKACGSDAVEPVLKVTGKEV
jgi:hypothetical protein